jgi:formimidoylglutamate deiminase
LHIETRSLWFDSALLPQGWTRHVRITFAKGCITQIKSATKPHADDERHAIALPGLPNLHSHAFQRGMAGLAERRGPSGDNFWSWREAMYRFLDHIDPDDCEAIAAQLYMEMLESGFTRAGEFHYLHHNHDGTLYENLGEMAERIAAAAQATGIGLTLLPVFYAHSGFGGAPPVHGQRRFITSLDQFSRLIEASRNAIATLDGGIIGIAPHSLRAATLPEIAAVVAVLVDGPIHIHAAEQTLEVEECLAQHGRRPVELLLDEAGVDQHWCLIHATHMTETETQRLAASGAVAGLCPITEANLGDGVFSAPAFLSAGGHFGIGSDSNILIDPAQELRQLEYAQRLTTRARNVLALAQGRPTGRALFDAALAGGSQALGVTSGLAADQPADIISLNTADSAFIGRQGDDLLDAWIFAVRHNAIDCVWRHGDRLVSGGRHHGRDIIEQRFKTVMRKLLA